MTLWATISMAGLIRPFLSVHTFGVNAPLSATLSASASGLMTIRDREKTPQDETHRGVVNAANLPGPAEVGHLGR